MIELHVTVNFRATAIYWQSLVLAVWISITPPTLMFVFYTCVYHKCSLSDYTNKLGQSPNQTLIVWSLLPLHIAFDNQLAKLCKLLSFQGQVSCTSHNKVALL